MTDSLSDFLKERSVVIDPAKLNHGKRDLTVICVMMSDGDEEGTVKSALYLASFTLKTDEEAERIEAYRNIIDTFVYPGKRDNIFYNIISEENYKENIIMIFNSSIKHKVNISAATASYEDFNPKLKTSTGGFHVEELKDILCTLLYMITVKTPKPEEIQLLLDTYLYTPSADKPSIKVNPPDVAVN